jgi:hypothetical protein
MAHYRICKLEQYQHYKDRAPPWVKLHRNLLTSNTWVTLDDAGRVLAIACMLIAAETKNEIPADPAYMRRRAYLDHEPDFQPLIAVGFIELVSDSKGLPIKRKQGLATSKQVLASDTKCSPETEERQSRAEEIRAGARKSQIPSDWKPDAELIEYARGQGCIDPIDTFERFRLHHASKGTLHKDWRLAAQYWCRNEKNFPSRKPGIVPRMQTVASQPSPDDWKGRVDWYRKKGMWSPNWGPNPDQPGCFAPKEFLQ